MMSSSRRMKIGDFLLRRLEEAGVRHLFGVPGDYNLELLQQLQDSGALKWIGTCNELNASYAADGYARLNGLGALLVTNGVGALSAINGVGGSYSEHVPVICIAGSIPLRSIDRRLGMHHTMADGTYDHFLDAYAHVTAAHARLTPRNAATEIDRLIRTAWREKLPVYMELPSDIAYLDIEIPAGPLTLADPPSDPERLRSCIAAIAGRLSAATSPAILVDADADRFGVASELVELAEKMQSPVAVINTAKAVIDETFSHYLGIYIGKASEPHVREAIETSDCLLSIGYRPLEVTTGDFSASLPANTIHARGHSVDVGDDNYQAVTLKEVLKGVVDVVPQVRNRAPRHAVAAVAAVHADGSARLTQAAYWQAIQGYLRPGDVLFVDNGTSYALFGLKFPPKCTFIGSVNWRSIGYSVGALLGTLTAAPERRHLLFVGDGSLQVTAQELSTILRHDHKPGSGALSTRPIPCDSCGRRPQLGTPQAGSVRVRPYCPALRQGGHHVRNEFCGCAAARHKALRKAGYQPRRRRGARPRGDGDVARFGRGPAEGEDPGLLPGQQIGLAHDQRQSAAARQRSWPGNF
jgi:indolepyruvate decarboxylase